MTIVTEHHCDHCAHRAAANRPPGERMALPPLPETVKAQRALDTAQKAYDRQHEVWSEAEQARRALDFRLWQDVGGYGQPRPSRKEQRDLDRLTDRAKSAWGQLTELGEAVVAARQACASAQDIETRRLVASWSGEQETRK